MGRWIFSTNNLDRGRRWGGAMGMLPDIDLVAAQCATYWAQKFTLLLTFLTSQEKKAEIELIIS